MSRPGAPRLVLAAFGGGFAGGAAAGGAARLAMYVIRVMNPSHNGETTHAGYEVGRWTMDGTLSLVTEGMFTGVLGAVVYLLLRPLLPRRRSWVRGLVYGLLVFSVFGSWVLDGSYEYFRFVSTWVAVAMFAAIYPLYGLVVAVVADRLASPSVDRRRHRVAQAVLGAFGLLAVAFSVVDISRTYFG